MFRRRRPLARAAVVGGVAYTAGKAGANSAAGEPDQNAPAEEPVTQDQPAADPAPAAPSADESMEELSKLKGLLDTGVLTQAEFDAQKQKILQSM
jgi:membrane protease subunit (stomatin/prohibitin family)